MVKKIKRWFLHAFTPPWRQRVLFSKTTLKAIETAIQQSETTHSGELRFAIENALTASQVWHGLSSYQRALELFAKLHVWDTEENSGVLIYLLLAERTVHIIADRGINKRVTQAEWDDIVRAMQSEFRSGNFERGSVLGIEQITALLASHFPATADNPNELPDAPIIID
jgi:uncharacterized membrane protein